MKLQDDTALNMRRNNKCQWNFLGWRDKNLKVIFCGLPLNVVLQRINRGLFIHLFKAFPQVLTQSK